MHNTPERVTISFSVPNRRHIIIGAAITAAAIAATVVYLQLPTNHPHANAIVAGALAATGFALAYWLRCFMQHLRDDNEGLSTSIEASRAEAQGRQETVLDSFDQIGIRLSDLGNDIAENRSAIKEIVDSLNEITIALHAATGAIEALQDCYLEEGQAPPKEDPEEA